MENDVKNAKTIADVAGSAGTSVVGLGEGARGGSGVVVEPGRILTLARNLRGERVTVTLAGGAQVSANVLASDGDRGVALLEADTSAVPALGWPNDNHAPAIGEAVFALADPGGRGLRATAGAVSSGPQSLRGPRGRLVEGLIEHTAPLPRGSAGGPLLDASGELLGINAVRQAHGLILALPLAGVREALAQSQAADAPRERRLGVAVVSPRMARRLRRAVGLSDREGVLVRGVAPGSPAADAGVQRGDLIVGMGGEQVSSLDELFAALDTSPLQQPVALQIVRGEQERELEVVLGGR
jgi:serine protease Do